MPDAKSISIIVGRGPDPLGGVYRFRDAVQSALAGSDLCSRVVFNLVEAPAVGSNLRADMMVLDGFLEVWTAASQLERVQGILRDLQAAHDVEAMHFSVAEKTVIPSADGRAAVKRLTLIRRLAGLSREDFRKHWTNVHGKIARNLPFARGYAQNLVMTGDGELDGFAILHFDTVDRVQAAFGSPVGKELIADTPRFCGAAASFRLSEYQLLPVSNA